MKWFRTNSTFLKFPAVLIIAVFLGWGCSRSPLNTEDTVGPNLLKRTPVSASTAQLSGADMYVEQVISAANGGQLAAYDVVLDIPAGAIDNDTLFFINIPDIDVFYNEFGTEGLVFNKPVKVTMSYRDADLSGIKESSIRIGWYNDNTGTFVDVACQIDFKNKVVIGQVNHFSAYALISD